MTDNLLCAYLDLSKHSADIEKLNNPIVKLFVFGSEEQRTAFRREYTEKSVKKWHNILEQEKREVPKIFCRISESMVVASKMMVITLLITQTIETYRTMFAEIRAQEAVPGN